MGLSHSHEAGPRAVLARLSLRGLCNTGRGKEAFLAQQLCDLRQEPTPCLHTTWEHPVGLSAPAAPDLEELNGVRVEAQGRIGEPPYGAGGTGYRRSLGELPYGIGRWDVEEPRGPLTGWEDRVQEEPLMGRGDGVLEELLSGLGEGG